MGVTKGALPGGLALVAMAALALVSLIGASERADAATKELTRYSIVYGCFAMKPAAGGKFIAQTDAGYTATAPRKGIAEGWIGE